MNVPINTRLTAWFIKKFLGLFEFETVALFVDDNTPYKFVILQGNPSSAILGIRSMVNSISIETGKPEQEILQMIAKAHQIKV